jgi:lipid-A-disaccharide synthase
MDLEALRQLDAQLLLLVNRVDDPTWELLLGYGTDLGTTTVLAVLLLIGLRLFDRRRFPRNFALLGLALLLCVSATSALKQWVDRPRPRGEVVNAGAMPDRARELPGGRLVREYQVGDRMLAATSPTLKVIGHMPASRAFPSGHSAAAFACAAGWIYAFRSRWRWLLLLPAAFIGWSRVASGVHFPLDVIAGAALGAGLTTAFLWATERFHGLAAPRLSRAPRGPRPPGPPRVMLVVGEASADRYGARILEALRGLAPDVHAFGIGGEHTRRAGLDTRGDARALEIVGFIRVLASLPALLRLYLRMVRLLSQQRPDVLLCIDLPDFNLMLALQARARGVPVLFDISPQLWAWRPGRIDKLADRITRMIVAFPFELPFYERAGVPVAYHGHPILELLAPRFASREEALAQLGLDPARRICVLAPGSRRSELAHHTRPLFGAAARMQRALPDLQFAVPLAPGIAAQELERAATEAGVDIVCTTGDHFDLFRSAELGLICSGTATLEAALAELPMLIFYRVAAVDAWIARRLLTIDRIGLPNIVLGGNAPVFPELLQRDVSAERLAELALALLGDADRLATLRNAGQQVRQLLSRGDTSQAVAREILALARDGPRVE